MAPGSIAGSMRILCVFSVCPAPLPGSTVMASQQEAEVFLPCMKRINAPPSV